MFFITYLKRELRRRMRQAIFIALGLAVGIGLVITVIGASNGVKHAQDKVLADLYGVGTDLTVTTSPGKPSNPGQGNEIQIGNGPGSNNSNGPTGQECTNGKCHALKGGDVIDTLAAMNYGSMNTSEIAQIEHLAHVKSATGGLLLEDNRIEIPTSNNGTLPQPTFVSVDGIDPAHEAQGPIANAGLTKGRNLKTADTTQALVDQSYATSHDLKLGDTVTLANTKFTIVGILSQPEATSPPNVYIPLAEAQKLSIDPATSKSLLNKVDTIYVTADSAADIAAVQSELQHLIPGATITTEASLASQITGSLASTAKLANELGKWLAVLVLIAAAAVAILLTLGAVARRTPEFGTLKALGWRGRRIVAQLLGESVATGIVGGLLGIGLGFGGVAIIDKVAPKLTATVPTANSSNLGGFQSQGGGPGAGPITRSIDPAASAHSTVSVPMSASVTIAAIVLAVLLAIAAGLLAGSFGGWRAARLRPAAALAKVG